MHHIYRERRDWGPAAFNFSWGMNAAVRGASNRSLKFADLNMSYGFGPEEAGPLSRALLLVMRKGGVHKDRHETDKQVCCWRHRDYNLCSVLSTLMHVLWTLSGDSDINFSHPDKAKRAPWWDTDLIIWDNLSGKCKIGLKYRKCPCHA